MLGIYVAFASAIWITVYFTTSIRRYVDRAHAEIRQKEKMLGIGQISSPSVQSPMLPAGQRAAEHISLHPGPMSKQLAKGKATT